MPRPLAVTFDSDGGVSFGSEEIRRSRLVRQAVGEELVASSRRAWDEQRAPDGTVWQARSVPNIAGMVSDFSKGRADPKPNRLVPRPALIDTGRMRRSIGFRLEAGRVIPTVGVDYGMPHREGGATTITITPAVRRAAIRWLDRRDQDDVVDKRLRGAVRNDALTIQFPARDFLGADDQAQDTIRTLVRRGTIAARKRGARGRR